MLLINDQMVFERVSRTIRSPNPDFDQCLSPFPSGEMLQTPMLCVPVRRRLIRDGLYALLGAVVIFNLNYWKRSNGIER